MARHRGWGLAAAWLVAAWLVAACGGPVITPPPVTPAPTRDPRGDVIDQAEAAWKAQQPDTYAYTSSLTRGGDGTVTTYRVTGMDGHVERQAISGGAPADSADPPTVEGAYDAARAALAGDGSLDLEVDQLYGYLGSVAYTAATPGGTWSRSIDDFTTAATRSSAARAREALDELQRRWAAVGSPAWEYTWSRFTAADAPGATAGWRVHHEDGSTTITAADGSSDATPPDAVTIGGTVASLAAVLAAGGWVDVAADAVTGLDALVAVDPSPSVRDDAFWIRIDTTDLAAQHAAKALASARDRWSGARPKRYSYTWRFAGADRAWTYRVSVNGDKVTIKPGEGAPPVAESFAAPDVTGTFDLVERVLAGGGGVSATYEKKLGYPTRVVLPSATGTTPAGEITIDGFKTR